MYQIKDIANIQTGLNLIRKKGKPYNKTQYSYTTTMIKSFSKSGRLIDNTFDNFITNEPIADKYLSKKGDILIRLRAPNLAVFIDKKKHEGLIISSLIAKITPHPNINGEYLTHYLNSQFIQKAMAQKTESTIIPMLNITALGSLPVIVPTLAKQEQLNDMVEQSQAEIQLLEKLLALKTQLNDELFYTLLEKETPQ